MRGSPIHVVRVTERLPPSPGGKEVHVLELSRRQSAAFDLTVVASEGDPIPGVHVDFVRGHVVGRRGGLVGTYAFTRRAACFLRSANQVMKVDAVHVHGDFLEARMAVQAKRALGAVAGITIHGGLSPRWVRTLAAYVDGLDFTICVGSGVRDQLVAAGAKTPIHIISSGVDVGRVAAAARGGRVEATGILFVGSLDEVKGVDVLLEAYGLLRRVASVPLTIVGSGPEEHRLQRLAPEGVVFLGRRTRDEIYALMHAADVLVVPSRRLPGKSEGVPSVILEGLAAGLTVVATDTGSIRDVLCPAQRVGILIPEENAEALKAALATVVVEGARQEPERLRAVARDRDWTSVATEVQGVITAAFERCHS